MNTESLALMIGQVAGGVIIGGVCGLLPLIFGIFNKKTIIGVISIIITIAFGCVCTCVLLQPAFLSIFPAVIMTLIIFLVKKMEKKR